MGLKIFLSAIVIVTIAASAVFAQTESMTVTTYYPAPFGAYQQFSVNGGTAAANTHGRTITLQAEGGGTGATNGGNIILMPGAQGTSMGGVPGRVGIGTANPAAGTKLEVAGGPIKATDGLILQVQSVATSVPGQIWLEP